MSKVPKLLLYTPPLLASRTQTATCQTPGVLPVVLQLNVLVLEKACAMVQLPAPGARVKNWYCAFAQVQPAARTSVVEGTSVAVGGGRITTRHKREEGGSLVGAAGRTSHQP